jgi:hypothetical protein
MDLQHGAVTLSLSSSCEERRTAHHDTMTLRRLHRRTQAPSRAPVKDGPFPNMNGLIDLTDDGHEHDEPLEAARVVDLAAAKDSDDSAIMLIGVDISSDVVDLLQDDDDDEEAEDTAAQTKSFASDFASIKRYDQSHPRKSRMASGEESDGKSIPHVSDDSAMMLIGVDISSDVVDLLQDDEDDEEAEDTAAFALTESFASDFASIKRYDQSHPRKSRMASGQESDGKSTPHVSDDSAMMPIGVNISSDVVDLLQDDEDDEKTEDTAAYAQTENFASVKRSDQSHPRKHIIASGEDSDGESTLPHALDDSAKLPIGVDVSAIGVDISSDVVDLLADDEENEAEDTDVYAQAQADSFFAPPKRSVQSHPKKYIMASRKRKREKALLKEAEERANALQQKPKAADKFNPENIPGGCNFVVIDDDSSEDELEFETSAKQSGGLGTTRTTKPVARAVAQKWVSKDNAAPPYQYQKKQQKVIPHENSFRRDIDYNFHISQEDAFVIQERMFREAAARVARLHSSNQVKSSPQSGGIVTPMFDIAERYPDHWRWKEPYACLGLPRNSSLTLVKSQYRRLAKIYHPDKSKHADAAAKFHGIATAYRKLSQRD